MFPNLKNRKFTDLSTNKTVMVVDQFENIAILDSKQRIDVKRLLDNGFYDEYIDPSNFFGEKNYQIFADKIKSIPNETLENMKDDDSAIVTNYDPEEEKRMLLEKAMQMSNPVSAIQSQMDKFRDLMDEEIQVINQDFSQPSTPVTRPSVFTEVVSPRATNPTNNQFNSQQPLPQPSFADPIITMFNNVKRNTEFSISINIDNKIPRPDFIEMMEDSYETSIIEYLADEFTSKILNDPNIIKDKIKTEIKNIVYKDKVETKEEKVDNQHEVKTETKSDIKNESKIQKTYRKRTSIDTKEVVDKK